MGPIKKIHYHEGEDLAGEEGRETVTKSESSERDRKYIKRSFRLAHSSSRRNDRLMRKGSAIEKKGIAKAEEKRDRRCWEGSDRFGRRNTT